MKEFWNRLKDFDDKDWLGMLGWLVMALLVKWFALLLMIGREFYLYKRYNLSRFGWENVIRYGIMITFISTVLSLDKVLI
nr:MAG TPA: hypothetical protein [Caudoviricetes sp.]